jgi:DNA-binding response OmpR family regulator
MQRDARCRSKPLGQPEGGAGLPPNRPQSPPLQTAEKAPMKHPVQQRSLILVVDEQAEVLDELATVLSGADFACRCCATVEDAVAAAESSPPDLIISGIWVNGCSGQEMCGRIREGTALGDVPVMFLCSSQVPDVIRRSDSLGGTYYLRRPFDADVLVELVETALGSAPLVGSHDGQTW